MLRVGELIKAAKEHRCKWCGEQIDRGEHYYHWTVHLGNLYDRNRMHTECYSHYRRTPNGHFTPHINKRHMTTQEVAIEQEETGLAYTVIVHRSASLACVHDESRSSDVTRDIFICRIRASTSGHAQQRAMEQALAYDLAVWNGDAKNLYRQKPLIKHYQPLNTLPGFPTLVRPE